MSHQIPPTYGKGPSTSPNLSGIQFYNPTKDLPHSSLLNQHCQSSNSLNNNPSLNKLQSAKQFNFKPTSMNDIKFEHQDSKGSSTSTFLKSSNQHGGSSKFIPGTNKTAISSAILMNKTINSGSTTTASFISPMHNKSLNS